MSGHLFVVQGDLLRLACDAVVIPCDDDVYVNRVWKELLPADRIAREQWGWIHVNGCVIEDHQVGLPPSDGRHISLVVTAQTESLSVEELVDRVVHAVGRAARGLHHQQGRHLPLIALPLVGTGAGGLQTKRGLVVGELVPRLMELARTVAFDVALVLHDRRDFAAVQAARAQAVASGAVDTGWEALPAHLRHEADLLGQRAARGELSLFLGSGVSAPLGLPSWKQLLTRMGEHAKVGTGWQADDNPLIEAEHLKAELGDAYEPFMTNTFDLKRHALGHALLADLKISQMVTTNYDRCLELALDSIHGEENYRVLTRRLPVGGKPWLLKLHGDISRPSSLVLTDSDYQRLDTEGAALHGVVQALMLTSHLLFVGFSLTDYDFLSLAQKVRSVREASDDATPGPLPPSGTALALHESALASQGSADQIRTLPMAAGVDRQSAARMLEVFLDRLSWAAMKDDKLAAEYLLDHRFDEGASSDDKALREALKEFDGALSEAARRSSGWNRVEQTLLHLGLRREETDGDAGEVRGTASRVGRWGTDALAVEGDIAADVRVLMGGKPSSARELALEIARCPLLAQAAEHPMHACHDVAAVQLVASRARQVPEAWAGALLTARIVFVSSNPSISEAKPGSSPLTAEAYPTGASSDETIARFLLKRFDPSVKPKPFVVDDRHLQLDGEYAKHKTRFWTSIRARASELLEYPADPNADYVLTEVVHCKSKKQTGVANAAATCAERYLDRILELTPATVVVVVGSIAHEHLQVRLDLPQPPYNVIRVVGGRERRVVFLWHPSSFKPHTFSGLYDDLDELRADAKERR